MEDHSTPEPVPEPEMPGQMHDTQAAAAGADDGLDIFAAPVTLSGQLCLIEAIIHHSWSLYVTLYSYAHLLLLTLIGRARNLKD